VLVYRAPHSVGLDSNLLQYALKTATTNGMYCILGSRPDYAVYIVSVYIAVGLWRMRLNYDGTRTTVLPAHGYNRRGCGACQASC